LEALSKLLRRLLPQPDEKIYGHSDMELVIEKHLLLLQGIASHCPNVTSQFLKRAALDCYSMNRWQAKLFADRIHDALCYCRAKNHSRTSGKKLSQGVKLICAALDKEDTNALPAHPSLPVLPTAGRTGTAGKSLLAIEDSPPTKAPPDSPHGILAMYGSEDTSASCTRNISRHPTLSSDDGELFSAHGDKETGEGKGRAPASSSDAPTVANYTQYLDNRLRKVVRLHKDGRLEEATMTPGSDGFALASFSDESSIVTEMPNILIDFVPAEPKKKAMKAMKATKAMKRKKKKAMKAMKKRKVKDDSEEEEKYSEDEEDEEEVEEEDEESEVEEPVAKPAKEVLKKPAAHPAEEQSAALDGVAPAVEVVKRTYGKMWYKNSNAFGIRQQYLAKRQIFTVQNSEWTKEQLTLVADKAIKMLEEGESEDVVKTWSRQETGRT
jgi:hypothetical protein